VYTQDFECRIIDEKRVDVTKAQVIEAEAFVIRRDEEDSIYNDVDWRNFTIITRRAPQWEVCDAITVKQEQTSSGSLKLEGQSGASNGKSMKRRLAEVLSEREDTDSARIRGFGKRNPDVMKSLTREQVEENNAIKAARLQGNLDPRNCLTFPDVTGGPVIRTGEGYADDWIPPGKIRRKSESDDESMTSLLIQYPELVEVMDEESSDSELEEDDMGELPYNPDYDSMTSESSQSTEIEKSVKFLIKDWEITGICWDKIWDVVFRFQDVPLYAILLRITSRIPETYNSAANRRLEQYVRELEKVAYHCTIGKIMDPDSEGSSVYETYNEDLFLDWFRRILEQCHRRIARGEQHKPVMTHQEIVKGDHLSDQFPDYRVKRKPALMKKPNKHMFTKRLGSESSGETAVLNVESLEVCVITGNDRIEVREGELFDQKGILLIDIAADMDMPIGDLRELKRDFLDDSEPQWMFMQKTKSGEILELKPKNS